MSGGTYEDTAPSDGMQLQQLLANPLAASLGSWSLLQLLQLLRMCSTPDCCQHRLRCQYLYYFVLAKQVLLVQKYKY